MKYNHIYLTSILYCLFAISPLNAQINLSVSSEKPIYKLSEPVILYVSVSNVGNEMVKICEDFEPQFTEYKYFITNPDNEEKTFSPVVVLEPLRMISSFIMPLPIYVLLI